MKTSFIKRNAFLCLLLAAGCTDHGIVPEPGKFFAEQIVSNLSSPFAAAKGINDYLWITQVGTGHDDGKISVIAPDRKVYDVITGFTSEISEEEGLPDGLTHLQYKDGMLYIIQGVGGLFYKVDVSKWHPGDGAIQAGSLTPEKIGDWIVAQNLVTDNNETHLYNLTWGWNGDLYFTDAAANIIVRRKSTDGALSVVAEMAPVANSKFPAVGPPVTDFVPTGIAFDGSKLLVSSLTGFPFNDNKALIRQIDGIGNVSDYKGNFTLLTDIVLTPANKPLALQFAKFTLANGFLPNSGKVTDENGNVVIDGLMMPTDIERTGDRTYYMVSMAAASVTKLTY